MIACSAVDNCLAAQAGRLDSICKSKLLSGCSFKMRSADGYKGT